MDGNGRWAKTRSLARIRGHRQGVEAVRAAVRTAGEIGVEFLTLYAFSSENWSRPQSEIRALMELLKNFLKSEIEELNENNVQLHTIGEIERLPASVQRQIAATKSATAANTGLKLVLALSYGARQEITRAVRTIAQKIESHILDPRQISEELISRHLDTQDYPDPELLIRTSGEMRLSNFLLWQISYAEFVVLPVLWPDFRKEHLIEAVREFGNRQRRFGGIASCDLP